MKIQMYCDGICNAITEESKSGLVAHVEYNLSIVNNELDREIGNVWYLRGDKIGPQ
jgi:hypothetical protein